MTALWLFVGFSLGVGISGIFGGLLGLAWMVRKDLDVETSRNGARPDAGTHGGIVPRPAEPAGGLTEAWKHYGRDQ